MKYAVVSQEKKGFVTNAITEMKNINEWLTDGYTVSATARTKAEIKKEMSRLGGWCVPL